MPRWAVVGVLCFIASFAAFSAPAREAAQRGDNLPNVLLITIDTLRADHLSSYGYHKKTSPRIDQLASEGVRFEKVHTVIPLTGPSHLSLFTSRYPQEHGARINGTAPPQNSRWLSLPQVLRRFGYRNSAFVSAWPLIGRLTQLNGWFDEYDETMTQKYDLVHSSRAAQDVTLAVNRWLDQNSSGQKPFFLWAHYFDPHSPYEMKEGFDNIEPSGHPKRGPEPLSADMAKRIERYDSEIAFTDFHVGRLLDRVDRLGLRDSTLVVLTADHGESLGENGYIGHGRRLDEGIVRVPLILRYPKKIKPGNIVAQNVSLLDIAPTVLDLAGVVALAKDDMPWSFSGRSLATVAAGGDRLPERPMRYVAFAGRKGFAPGWMSWMWSRKSTLPLHLGVTTGAEKFVWSPGSEELAVLDLEQDPFELEPHVVEPGERVYKRRTASLQRWFESTDLEESELEISDRDAEVLKSLGYLK
jgi:arylsulfatase A-like enzyme